MWPSRNMREILVADAAVERGLISPEEAARALAGLWEEQSLIDQLSRSDEIDQANAAASTVA